MKLNVSTLATIAVGFTLTILVGCSSREDGGAEEAPDAAELLAAAAEHMESATSFHFVLEHEGGRSPIVLGLEMERAEGDVVRPERLRADVEARVTQLGNARIEVSVVAVGDDAVISNPFQRDKWVSIPGSNPLAEVFDPARGATALLKTLGDARVTGADTIDGNPVWRVEGPVDAGGLASFTPNAEAGWTINGTAWIDRSGGALRRARLDGSLGPDDDEGIIRVLTLSRFNEPLVIELPD